MKIGLSWRQIKQTPITSLHGKTIKENTKTMTDYKVALFSVS